MCPLVNELKRRKNIQTVVCVTGQHRQMLDQVLETFHAVLVHGDTSTTFVTALDCIYRQIPVGHVEAGLFPYDIHSPYPEEFNRQSAEFFAINILAYMARHLPVGGCGIRLFFWTDFSGKTGD